MLNEEHYKFAKQFGATHLVVHLVDYFGSADNHKENANQPIGEQDGWDGAGDGRLWSLEEILKSKKEINSHDLEWEAVTEFGPDAQPADIDGQIKGSVSMFINWNYADKAAKRVDVEVE